MWQRLVVGLKFENRFSLDDDTEKFVSSLLKYGAEHKSVTLNTETLLFRARINDDENRKATFPISKMGAPPRHLVGHGRLNPIGIPYLYLASGKTTAISEVRPWVGCGLTVAAFSLVKEARLMNLSQKHFVNIPAGQEFEGPEITWRDLITWLFSVPFDPRDDAAYIPTQFLAERIKNAGFDGIIYDSALSSDGYNITLFDVSLAEPVRREHALVTSVSVDAKFTPLLESES